MTQTTLPHYSHSSQKQASECARQYYYRKIRGLTEKPKSALIIGHIVDHVCNAILSGIIQDDPVANPEELANAMAITELSLADPPAEVRLEVTDFLNAAIDERAFSQYRMMIDFQPKEVQQEGRLWINGMSTPILLFVDAIGERKKKPLIIDNKTAGRKPSKPVQYRDQMAVYAAWYYKVYGEFPDTEILCLVKTKHPYWMRMPVELRWQDVTLALEAFWRHDDLVKRGQYPPNRNSVFCTEKLCSFYDLCHRELDQTEETLKNLLQFAEAAI